MPSLTEKLHECMRIRRQRRRVELAAQDLRDEGRERRKSSPSLASFFDHLIVITRAWRGPQGAPRATANTVDGRLGYAWTSNMLGSASQCPMIPDDDHRRLMRYKNTIRPGDAWPHASYVSSGAG